MYLFSVFCPTLEAPDSGTISQISDGRRTAVTYTCSDGYMLKGVNILTCESNGSWSAMEPSCGTV